MATIPGTYVRTLMSLNERINGIVDVMLAPSLLEFRQISIYHERAVKVGPSSWRLSYQNWNPDYNHQMFLNNNPTALADTEYSIDYNLGIVTLNSSEDGDNLLVTYNFDYFPIYMLEGFIVRSIDVVNTGSTGTPTNYTIADAPGNWDGVIADLTFAMCMERLILDYDLWKGKLIFAITAQELADGNADILGSLETLKQNAEERAYRTMENEKFKSGNYLSAPTRYYYEALLVGGSTRRQGAFYGKLRGWQPNKYLGRTL